jgi:hypothetical protein
MVAIRMVRIGLLLEMKLAIEVLGGGWWLFSATGEESLGGGFCTVGQREDRQAESALPRSVDTAPGAARKNLHLTIRYRAVYRPRCFEE